MGMFFDTADICKRAGTTLTRLPEQWLSIQDVHIENKVIGVIFLTLTVF